MTTPRPDKLADRVGRIGDRVSHVVALASPSPDLLRANEGIYAGLGTLLAAHAPGGCGTCRDGDGDPVGPGDCEVRKIIAGCLTRTIDQAAIDTLASGS